MFTMKSYPFILHLCFKRSFNIITHQSAVHQSKVIHTILTRTFVSDFLTKRAKHSKPDVFIKPSKIKHSRKKKPETSAEDFNFEMSPADFFRKRTGSGENTGRNIMSVYEDRLNSDEYQKDQSLKDTERYQKYFLC